MLAELTIENFAIIDRLLLRLEPGLTVITGETGTGKSIIIDALQAALGARLSPDVVRDQGRVAAVEAVFHLDAAVAGTLVDVLEANGIEGEESLILRREIGARGRGTARVNGRAVPLGVLAAVGGLLVDIHGQSEHLSVLRRDRQLDLLDRYGGTLEARQRTAVAVREHGRLTRAFEALAAGRRDAEQRLDLLRFQVEEIESAGLRPGEEEELKAERTRLGNAERLTALAERAYQQLGGESGSAVDRVGDAHSALQALAAIDPSIGPTSDRLESTRYELEDLAQEIRRYRDSIEVDPGRLGTIEERLDVLSRLARKFGPTITAVLSFGAEARRQMGEVENVDERLATLEVAVRDAASRASECAARLSEQRTSAAEQLTRAMAGALRGLGLRGTEFQARLIRQEAATGLRFPDGRRYVVGPTGADAVEFVASFNPGEALRPLERVASGGETSRFLLALKSALAEVDRTPTLVFDEVDVGVGGRGGAVVGERLRALSTRHQVVSITHLPQVAAMADQHLTVVKGTSAERTSVAMRALTGADRVREIAEMMAGVGTAAALRNAAELLAAREVE